MSDEGSAALTSKVKFDLDKSNDCQVITVADVKLLLANDSWIAVNTRAPDIVLRFSVLFVAQSSCVGKISRFNKITLQMV